MKVFGSKPRHSSAMGPIARLANPSDDDLVVGKAQQRAWRASGDWSGPAATAGDVAHDQAVAMVDRQVGAAPARLSSPAARWWRCPLHHFRSRCGASRFDNDAQDDLIEMLALPPTPISVVPLQNGPPSRRRTRRGGTGRCPAPHCWSAPTHAPNRHRLRGPATRPC